MLTHPLWNPEMEQIVYHGSAPQGYPDKKGDLGPYPRAGHSGLYPLILGLIFYFIPKAWLLSGDNYVYIARGVNVIFDTATIVLLFDIVRQNFSKRIAYIILLLLIISPFVIVFGSLAYLDSPGTFFATLSFWYYLKYMRNESKITHCLLLGAIISCSILIKHSNLILIPAFACLMILFPPRWTGKKLFSSFLYIAFSSIVTFSVFCNPFSLYQEIRNPTDPEMEAHVSLNRASKNFKRLSHPDRHYHVGTQRHKGYPYVKNKPLIRAYEVTTPLYIAGIALSALIVLFSYGYRAIPLVSIIVLFIAVIPLGSVVRRLYLLIPFCTLIVSMALAKIAQWTGGYGSKK